MGMARREAAFDAAGAAKAGTFGGRGFVLRSGTARGFRLLGITLVMCVAAWLICGRSEDGAALAAPEPAWPIFACKAAGMALDGRGVLYMADAERGSVWAVMPDGERLELARGVADPGGLAVDGRRRVYVSSTSQGVVYRIELDGRMRRAATGLSEPGALAVDRDGGLYVALTDPGRVVRIPWRALEEGVKMGGLAYLQ
jgi:hypothetical protein